MSNYDDKWISKDKRTQKLVIRFRVKGFEKQFYRATGLDDTPQNRARVQDIRDAIQTDINLGRFDPTLKEYQFNPTRNSKTQNLKTQELPTEAKKYQWNLLQLWDKFTDFKSTQLEQTTIKTNYVLFGRYIKKLPTQSLDDAVKIRDWLLSNTTRLMAHLILRQYSSCCDWAIDSNLIPDNPFTKLKIKKPRKRSTDNDSYRAFTQVQRDIIIKAFENHPQWFYYAPLIKFLFFTGCRHGEAFALTWADVNQDCTKVSITKSCNVHRILKGTKNGKKRFFSCGIGSKLQKLLLELRPPSPKPTDLIFTTKIGSALTSAALNYIWNGRKGACKGVVRELADRGLVPYLYPYSTRHTFATLALAKNIPAIDVACWMGDEVDTVHKYYSHPSSVKSECPDI
jgi:integrase